MRYDPTDITEECNSLDEKRERLLLRTSKSYLMEGLQNVPRYMVEVCIYNSVTSWGREDVDKRFGVFKDKDMYSYTLPDDLWEIGKRIIGWKGEE